MVQLILFGLLNAQATAPELIYSESAVLVICPRSVKNCTDALEVDSKAYVYRGFGKLASPAGVASVDGYLANIVNQNRSRTWVRTSPGKVVGFLHKDKASGESIFLVLSAEFAPI